MSTIMTLVQHDNPIFTYSMLLATKTYPNKLDRDGDTAVHIAIRENNLEILQTLLQHNVSRNQTKIVPIVTIFGLQADPNIPNHFGKFPLHIAVENNLLPLVKVLVDHGLDVDARDQVAGRTAIHLAVERQLEDMVFFLVKEAKVELLREDYNGVNAIELADNCNSTNIKKLLAKEHKRQI